MKGQPHGRTSRAGRRGDGERPGEMTAIVDNTKRRVGDFLRERIEAGSDLSIVSAYFTIYAYDALRDALESAGRTRFLHGEPGAVGVLDPVGDDAKAFRLDRDGGIELKRALAQKPLARACAAWIEKQVAIRTIDRANFLHGKLYHVARDGGAAAAAGWRYPGAGVARRPISVKLVPFRSTPGNMPPRAWAAACNGSWVRPWRNVAARGRLQPAGRFFFVV